MQPPPHTIIAVSQNVSREGGLRYIENRRMSKMTPVGDLSSSWRQRGILLIEASITKKVTIKTCLEQVDYIRNLSEKKNKARWQSTLRSRCSLYGWTQRGRLQRYRQ